jgi:hypothetical protein
MFVKELGKASAKDLNEQLNKVYKWQLNLGKIDESNAQSMIHTLAQKIHNIRSGNRAHNVERNPEFMEAIMVTRVLESWKNELIRTKQEQLLERELTPVEMRRREKYVKGMKPVEKDFKKRYGNRGDDVMHATATKMAKNESVHAAMNLLKFVLTEGDVDQARVTMAARDLADSVQDMVSKISDMQNEKLPSLVTAMKDEVGMDQATNFNQTASEALRTLLDAANAARDTLDNASRGVYGDQPMGGLDSMGGADAGMAAPAGDMGAGLDIPEPSELDTADSATGGPARLGREKRV